MIAMFLAFGIMTIALFLLYSRKVGSMANAITIYTGLKVTIEFILEPLAYMLNLYSYDFRSMFFINLLSFFGYAMFVIGLLIPKQPSNPRRIFFRPNHLILAWLLLIGAWVIYVPVLIEFRAYITEPRRIYELTRTGYGLYTFGSALLTFTAYAVFLMSTRKMSILFYVVLLSLLALKGNKGQFIVLAGIFVIAKVYLEGFKYSVGRSFLYAALAGIAMIYIFAFNYRGETDNIFVTIAEYSDYNRNGALIIQDDTAGYYEGQLTWESIWVSKIPRVVWPNKPKIFGEFRLAVQYFPQLFLLDQGSPSFGLGIYFADFGWLAFIIYPVCQLFCGLLLALCLNKMIVSPNIFYFVMAIYFSGNNILSSGAGFYVIEHAIIGVSLLIILKIIQAFDNMHDESSTAAITTSYR